MKKIDRFLIDSFEKLHACLPGNDHEQIAALRREAIDFFTEHGFPTRKIEKWRDYPIDQCLDAEYRFQSTPEPYRPIQEIFRCKIHDIGTNMFSLLNGWYLHADMPLTVMPNGMIAGSIFSALQQYPDLVLPYLLQKQFDKDNTLAALNQAFFNDGLFVYVPDHVTIDQPLQLVNLIETQQKLWVQNRNLIVLGKGASLSFVHCNDSIQQEDSFINNVTEIYLNEEAVLHYCKMENKHADSFLVDQVVIYQKAHSKVIANALTFNVGYLRNMFRVNLEEPFADVKLNGLYLVDRKQVVDNQVFVNHASPDCTSSQLYKGVLDEEAYANFNGHVLVAKDSQRTNAFQINNNITLTDEAKITTKPFLEIYADDVQCSHGATVGQLDENAMFYLRSRGICENKARLLLMYAFANEVVSYVNIINLRNQLKEMVQRRLRGELTLCDQCVLRCSDRKNFSFEIDVSKI